MSSYNHFDSSSSSSSTSSSSSSSDDGGIKSIYRGAAIVANVYERQRQKKRPRRGGYMQSRRYIPRNRIGADKILKRDYFDEGCAYTDETFLRRFRMKTSLFMKIHDVVLEHDPVNFQQRPDAAKKMGVSSLQKITTAIRMLAYGMTVDQCDEYLKVAETTATKSMKDFCTAINQIFAGKYLRTPTNEDIQHILAENAARGFLGILGSLNCMHWKWKNYPKGWHGSHVNGKIGAPTLILEVVATHNLWIWHCFFGMAGTNNDLNVLDNSHLFDRIVSGEAPACNFIVNGHEYTMGYYLSDGEYPKWATLIQTISQPVITKHKQFAQVQEAVRKDVERAFGVLQTRFEIVKGSVRLWDREECGLIIKTCIILHNMIVENEEDPDEWAPPEDEPCESVVYNRDDNLLRSNRINHIKYMTNEVTHSQLKLDLIEHLWNRRGDGDL